MGMSAIKIYAGNKLEKCYCDLNGCGHVKTLVDLLSLPPYTELFRIGYKTIVMVMFSLNEERYDDKWKHATDFGDEFEQFQKVCRYLNTFSDTEFILSNWESDHSLTNGDDTEIISSFVRLINTRQQAIALTPNNTNVKIALEINKIKSSSNCALTRIVPHVNCPMISYSCYDSQEIRESFEYAIEQIQEKMNPKMELFIGEFGFPINRLNREKVLGMYENVVNVIEQKNIRIAFYWNLYDNEFNPDGNYSGFGLITPFNTLTYMGNKIFNKKLVIFVSGGYSDVDKWRDANGINLVYNGTLEHNMFDPKLCLEGVQDTLRARDEFWKYVDVVSSGCLLHIFVSPLLRTLQTLNICLDGKPFMANTIVHVTPLLSEIGNCDENKSLNCDIKTEGILTEIGRHVIDVKFDHFDKYNGVMENGSSLENVMLFCNYIKKSKDFAGCCLLCFTHTKVIKVATNVCLSNFGRGNSSVHDYI